MKTPDLKPCPFCGGEALLQESCWPRWIVCTKCGAEIKSIEIGDAGARIAIEKWNRRVSDENNR